MSQPAKSSSPFPYIPPIVCSHCEASASLVCLTPAADGGERRTFQCRGCGMQTEITNAA